MPTPLSWDIFCRVVDNYGDAAVCWRLARELAQEHGGAVRLWIDRPETLRALRPDMRAGSAPQALDGVELRHWDVGAAAVVAIPADVVVQAFGGGLPDPYVQAAALRGTLWVVLEYLSAEPWVASHHGLPSPHPSRPIKRYFFFPGFTPDTGGVLREAGLLEKRDAFRADPARLAAFWAGLGFGPPAPDAAVVSLFGYAGAPVTELLRAWSEGDAPMVVALTASPPAEEAARWLGIAAATPGLSVTRGALELRFLPFLPQPAYDELLWACDWNFVRGEDSLVRAQWAGRPLVWQAYPQAEAAHAAKVEAFLGSYTLALPEAMAAPLLRLWRFWNGSVPAANVDVGREWAALAAGQAAWRAHGAGWEARLLEAGELADKLARFCAAHRVVPPA